MTHDQREAPQITMADIRKHTGEGMVSEQSVIDAANEVLKEIYTSPPPAEGWDEAIDAAKLVVERCGPDAGGGVREALEDAEDSFEFIRQKLINNLEEPERSAFWRAVDARERCRAALSTPPAAVEKEADDWRDDPSADERWNAGLDFAMGQFCAALGVDPKSVRWDAATETLDGDVNAVIWNILRARFGEDWDPAAVESNASVEARLREALEHYAKEYCEGWCEQDAGCANFDHDCGGCLARRALSAVGDEATKSDGIQSAYGEYTPITVRASTTLSSPTADRREIVARELMEKWPGDYAWGDETREPNELAFETADAILAALDGGAGE